MKKPGTERPAAQFIHQLPKRKPGRGRPPGKHSDPDYVQVGAYVQRRTYEAVKQKLAEQPSKDFSALVERLLHEWLSAGRFRDGERPSKSGEYFCRQLLLELLRRRKEIHDKNAKGRWLPENVSKIELTMILDWVQHELETFNGGHA
jgi:hypothetical protein